MHRPPPSRLRLACRAAALPLALAGCAHLGAPLTHEESARLKAQGAACAHHQAAANSVLATPPDPVTGASSGHHAHAVATAKYHACLAKR